jgi:hypothetical protein
VIFERKALIVSLIIGVGAAALPTMASAIGIDVNIAPPAARVELMPPPRAGFAWAPGHWVWRHHAHVWVGGRWITERRGYHWVADRWTPVGPRWHYERGHWER